MENTWPNSQKSMKIHTCTLGSTAPKVFLKRNKNLIGNFFHSEFPGDKDLKDHGL